ncbi:MAG: hypothetical protein EXX96DRAFT_522155 [Benjaminiella poitrasii]|nr:MAG: hypothetical protein EXX96DRAFT_522155 [Benjaminiella poitrasii]
MVNHSSSSSCKLIPAHICLSTWLKNYERGAWKKVKEATSKDRGAHCVAIQQVKQGDLLMTEEPFIRQLSEKHYANHCYYCFREIEMGRSVKCHVDSCRWRIHYCSMECERQGWSRSHMWFCRFPELAKEDPDVLFAFEGYVTSRSKGQCILPGLISHLESIEKSQLEKYQKKFENIASLFYLTKHTIDSLVTIFLQIKYNTFSIKAAESVPVESSFVVSREFIQLGRAIYLSASRLNHDCNPNSLISFGDHDHPCQLKVQCVQSIKEGQEITISYGPLATKHDTKERLKTLKDNYMFDCQCSSCCKKESENSIDMPSPEKIYKCQICKNGRLHRQQLKCAICGQPSYWTYFLKTEAEVEEYQKMGDYHKILQLQETIYHQDTIPIGLTSDKLAQIYCMEGQWKKAAQYSKRSLEVTTKVYGKVSVEVAEEMMKLSTILLNS